MCVSCQQDSVREEEKLILLEKNLLPGPQDNNYVFTCGACALDCVPTIEHKIKNGLEFTSSVLYTLQQSEGKRVFAIREIYYIAEKYSHLLKTNAKNLRNVVRAALLSLLSLLSPLSLSSLSLSPLHHTN
eukprot:Phypoly_transcript_08582.p1 GENE.Phypoly_transcript_08582~~Phypoly_transcript_08582.p1  ORF type:complete len:130 (-),score=24.20 Phypoly_transcript_08582:467-856(-)